MGSTRSTGQPGVVQSAGPWRVWVEMMGEMGDEAREAPGQPDCGALDCWQRECCSQAVGSHGVFEQVRDLIQMLALAT